MNGREKRQLFFKQTLTSSLLLPSGFSSSLKFGFHSVQSSVFHLAEMMKRQKKRKNQNRGTVGLVFTSSSAGSFI